MNLGPFKFMTLICISVIFFGAKNGVTTSDRTGSPLVNGANCNACHNGGEFTGNISLLGIPNNIRNNDTLNLALNVTNTDAVRGGFQIIALDQTSQQYVGTWIVGLGSKSFNINGGAKGLTHNQSRPFLSGEGDWKFGWIAPSTGGPFTLYYAVNLVNNDSSSDGDNAFVGSSNISLPVTYTAINIKQRNDYVVLEWETKIEINNGYFEVQKMSANEEFVPIGRLMTGTESTYSFVDKNPSNGISYYRIKQYDIDGSSSLSEVYSIDFKALREEVFYYFDPINKIIDIKSSLTKFTTCVFDQSGRTVLTHETNDPIDVSNLKSGIYFISLTTKERKSTSKLWIN